MSGFRPDSHNFDALNFDCDRTLADTLLVHYLTIDEALSEQGYRPEPEWHQGRAGLSSISLFNAYEAFWGVNLSRETLLARCLALYNKHLDQLGEHGFAAMIAQEQLGHVPMAVA